MADRYFVIGGWVLASWGALVVLWALFWDRPRGRRRCPKCWYDMTGARGLICPECGFAGAGEQAFFRTRRRPIVLWLGVLMALGALTATRVPCVRIEGATGFIPSCVLVLIAPVGEGAWKWQTVSVSGEPQPIGGQTRGWRYMNLDEHYPEWPLRRDGSPQGKLLVAALKRLDRQELTSLQSQQLLDRIFHRQPAMLRVVARDRWTRDAPLTMLIRLPAWIDQRGAVVDVRIVGEALPRVRYASNSSYTRYGHGPTDPALLGAVPPVARQIELEVAWYNGLQSNRSPTGDSFDESGMKRLWRKRFCIAIVDSAEEALKPVRLQPPLTAEGIDSQLTFFTSRHGQNQRLMEEGMLFLWVRDDPQLRQLDHCVAALRVRVRRDGELMAMVEYSARVWPFHYVRERHAQYPRPLLVDLKWLRELSTEEATSGTWTVELVPLPELALYDLRWNKYWADSVEFTVSRPYVQRR